MSLWKHRIGMQMLRHLDNQQSGEHKDRHRGTGTNRDPYKDKVIYTGNNMTCRAYHVYIAVNLYILALNPQSAEHSQVVARL